MSGRIVLVALGMSACVQDVVLARPRDVDAAATDADTDADTVGTDADTDSEARDVAVIGPVVTGALIATFDRAEESEPDRGETRFSFRWIDPGRAGSAGRLTVESSAGVAELPLTDGQYTGAQRGYADVYTLVMAYEGAVERYTVRSLRPHRIEAPSLGARVRPATPLEVRWEPAGAPSATLASNGLPETPVRDTGRFVLPATALMGAIGRSTEDTVRVRRAADVTVLGAAPGSTVRVVVLRASPFVVDPR
jgi:hypothetical protein